MIESIFWGQNVISSEGGCRTLRESRGGGKVTWISWRTRQQWSTVESSLGFSSSNHNPVLQRGKWMVNTKQIDPPRRPWISSGQIDQVACLPGQETIQIHHANVSSSHGQHSAGTQVYIGPIDEINSPQPVLHTPQSPIFGSNQNTPFIFQFNQSPSTPQSYPRTSDSMEISPQEESRDVDMGESISLISLKIDADSDEKENERQIVPGALKRVHGQRRRRHMSKSSQSCQKLADTDQGSDSGSDMDDHITPVTQNTANHYTLNMPVSPAVTSETPYILLG